MDSELRALLDSIDAWAEKNATDEVKIFGLWNVLAAMRGPDDENLEVKYRTTWPIRKAAFPRLCKALQYLRPYQKWVLECTNAPFYPHIPNERSHFYAHASQAAEVLGIKGTTT